QFADALSQLRSRQFQNRRHFVKAASQGGIEDAQHRELQSRNVDLQPGKPVAEDRIFDERSVNRIGAARGDGLQLPDVALGVRYFGTEGPLLGKQRPRDRPAISFVADEILHRYANLVEEDLVDVMALIDKANGAD